MLWAATFVVVMGLTAAGFMLGRRGKSAPPASPIASDAASFAKLTNDALRYSETHKRTYEDDALPAADAAPTISTTAAQPEISTKPSTSSESGSIFSCNRRHPAQESPSNAQLQSNASSQESSDVRFQ